MDYQASDSERVVEDDQAFDFDDAFSERERDLEDYSETGSGSDTDAEDIKWDTETSMEVPVFHSGKIFAYAILDKVDVARLGTVRINGKLEKDERYTTLQVTFNSEIMVLSHFVAGRPPQGMVKDHINRYVFDNRQCNLRDATFSQNSQNRRKKENCSSKYIGVTWDTQRAKWRIRATYNTKPKFLGFCDDEEEAGKIYDRFILGHFGLYAQTNNLLNEIEIEIALATPFIISEGAQNQLGTGIVQKHDKFYCRWTSDYVDYQSNLFDTQQEAIDFRASQLKLIADEKLCKALAAPIARDSQGIAIIITNQTRGDNWNVMVDDSLYYEINKFSWSKSGENANPQSLIDGKIITLPKFVLQLAGQIQQPGETIDHVRHDYSDCRLSNLRYANNSVQSQNRRKRKNCKSLYIGVDKQTTSSKFVARITFNGKRLHLGSFHWEIDAAETYNIVADILYPGSIRNIL